LKQPITVNITGTVPKEFTSKEQTAEWKYTLSGAVTQNETVAENGTVSITVENNAGATLPETGGMGTTIFYAVGGVMVAAAAILLVTKKRMSNNA
jgi:LPXTG-motif cell wall-anchored protein